MANWIKKPILCAFVGNRAWVRGFLAFVAVIGLTATFTASASAAEAPTKLYCETNLKAASSAADAAISENHEVHKALTSVAVGGGCYALLFLTGWADGGASALICGLATAGTFVATPAPANADVAAKAYDSVRDSRCLN